MARFLSPFCHSSTLTTFYFNGRVLPLRLLMSAPNLRNLEVFDVESCDLGEDLYPSPPFRLDKARYRNSPSVVDAMAHTITGAFSQLETLEVKSKDKVSVEAFVRLLSVASGSLKHLLIHDGGSSCKLCRLFPPLTCQFRALQIFKNVIMHSPGGSMGWIFNLESLSIDIDFEQADASHKWFEGFDLLDQRVSPLPRLERIEIKLINISVFDLKDTFDVNHRGWKVAHRLLSPSMAPAIQEISLYASWTDIRDNPNEFMNVNDFIIHRMSKAMKKGLKRCLPDWDGDRRRIRKDYVVGPYLFESERKPDWLSR